MSLLQLFFPHRPKARPPRPKVRPGVEPLEDRRLLTCATISGFVYLDANNNGLRDPGEAPLGGSVMQLRNAAGAGVATTVADGNGFYEFSTDQTVDTRPQTISQTLTFDDRTTSWTQSGRIGQFNPALGTLTSVEIINHGTLTGQIRVESLDQAAQTVTATVAGTVTLSGPGVASLVTNASNSQTFRAPAFDGVRDYGGSSGQDFGPRSTEGSRSVVLTSASALALYTGTGTVSFTERAAGSSSATSTGGNLLNLIGQTAGADVAVVYHYLPNNCLHAGSYTIFQITQPGGLIDGRETRGNVVPIPGSAGTDRIDLTLGSTNSTNNNFGELPPASVSGYVYHDRNNNALREPGENPIPGTLVTLTGTNDLGQNIFLQQFTGPDGSYHFLGLRPGGYYVTESQPAGYADGKDTLGNLGGRATNDQFFLNLGQGSNGVEYNFGEVQQITVTNDVPARGRLSKSQLLSSMHGRRHRARGRARGRAGHSFIRLSRGR